MLVAAIIVTAWIAVLTVVVAMCTIAGRADREEAAGSVSPQLHPLPLTSRAADPAGAPTAWG